MIRMGFCLTGVGLLVAAFLVGTHGLSGLWVLLMALAMTALITIALRLDYVILMSKPEALRTWTLRALMNEIFDLTDGRYSDHTAIYVEGDLAYHPIVGAFLAQIGGVPAVVLQPAKQLTEERQ